MATVFTVEQIANLIGQDFTVKLTGMQIIGFIGAYDNLSSAVRLASYLSAEEISRIESLKTSMISSVTTESATDAV